MNEGVFMHLGADSKGYPLFDTEAPIHRPGAQLLDTTDATDATDATRIEIK